MASSFVDGNDDAISEVKTVSTKMSLNEMQKGNSSPTFASSQYSSIDQYSSIPSRYGDSDKKMKPVNLSKMTNKNSPAKNNNSSGLHINLP